MLELSETYKIYRVLSFYDAAMATLVDQYSSKLQEGYFRNKETMEANVKRCIDFATRFRLKDTLNAAKQVNRIQFLECLEKRKRAHESTTQTTPTRMPEKPKLAYFFASKKRNRPEGSSQAQSLTPPSRTNIEEIPFTPSRIYQTPQSDSAIPRTRVRFSVQSEGAERSEKIRCPACHHVFDFHPSVSHF